MAKISLDIDDKVLALVQQHAREIGWKWNREDAYEGRLFGKNPDWRDQEQK